MVSLKAPRFDNVLFLQGLSERVRHFKLKCVAGLCSKLVFSQLWSHPAVPRRGHLP